MTRCHQQFYPSCEPHRDREDSRDTWLFAMRILEMPAKVGEIGAFLIRSSYEDYDRFLSILSSGYFIHSFMDKMLLIMSSQMEERMSGWSFPC